FGPSRAGCSRSAPMASKGNAEAFDLPFELDAARLLDPRAHRFAEFLDLGAGGVALVDEEVAVHLGDLGVADREPAAAGGVDQLPGLLAGRILEGRAAGPALDRLGLLAIGGDVVHLGEDPRGIAGLALEQGLGEDEILGRPALA